MFKSNSATISVQPKSPRFHFLKNWLWCLIILLALAARFWKIEYIPYANDADELAYVWAGQSLVKFGTPISWSSFEHANTQWHWTEISSENVVDTKVPTAKFVKPWFDHSFVLPLIMGTWSELLGYHFPSIPPALFYRLPFLMIAGINLALIYQIAKKAFGVWPALFSLTLISFSPTLLFAQRMVVSENLLATFVLLSIYLFITEQPIWSIILASAFAGLVKLPGLSIVPILGLAMVTEKKYKTAVVYGAGVAVLVIAGYCVYGASIDWSAFVGAMRDQSSRLLGWSNPAFIFSQPGFHTKAVLDFSYYVLLLLGMTIFFLPLNKITKVLAGATLASLLTVWVTSAELDMLGWYKIPLFCLLAINAGGALRWSDQRDERENSPMVGISILLAVMVLSNLGIVRFPAQPLPEAQLLRILVGAILLIGLLMTQLKVTKKIFVTSWLILLAIYAAQSFYVADKYFLASCKDRTCPTPTVTFGQVIRSMLKRN